MKRISIFFAIVVMLVASGFSPELQAAGVLIDAQGDVAVTLPGAEAAAATVGMELPDGSTVAVKPEAKASVLLESGIVDEIDAGKSYAVGSEKAQVKRTNLGGGIALAMREIAASGEGPTVHGMVKKVKGPSLPLARVSQGERKGFIPLSPVGTAMRLQPKIAFQWKGPIAWPSPVIVLDDAKKKQLAMRTLPADKTELILSTKLLGLAQGQRYSWYVASNEGGKPRGRTARFFFQVLSQAEERALDQELSRIDRLSISQQGKDLLKAQLYFQHKMYDAMVGELLPLWQKGAGSFIKKLLAIGYTRMGRVEEANAYR